MAKFLVEECEHAVAPLEKHCFIDSFGFIDDIANELRNFHSRLQTKLKSAKIDEKLCKMTLQNDIIRMEAEFNMKLLKASEEKGILESKLKVKSDELLAASKNCEKLQNDNMQLQIERDAAKLESDMMMTENSRLDSEKTSLEKEISRMQTNFDEELNKASEEKVQWESKLNEQLENGNRIQTEYDLELNKASEEKGELESKLSQVETNFEKIENELKKVLAERDTLRTKKEQLLEQSETEKCRIRTEFQVKLHAVIQKFSQFKLGSRIEFENMKKDIDGLKNDLIGVKANFENLQIHQYSSDKTESKAQFELEKVAMELQITEVKDLLEAVLCELNETRAELKQISSENDKLLIDKIQFQNEKSSLEKEKNRTLTECDKKLREVLVEKRQLESKVSMVETDLEKLRNENKISKEAMLQLHKEYRLLKIEKKRMSISFSKLTQEKLKVEENFEKLRIEKNELLKDLRKISKDGTSLANAKEQILEQSESEKRMRAEFQEKLHTIVQDLNRLKLSSKPAFEIIKNSFAGLNKDLFEVNINFERLQNETMILDDTNKNLRFELQNVQSNTLELEKERVKLQADLNMENSMSKIQIEAMKRQTADLDARNIRLSIENTKLEQKIDEMKESLEQGGIDGLNSRIQALEKERNDYKTRWLYVKSINNNLKTQVSQKNPSEHVDVSVILIIFYLPSKFFIFDFSFCILAGFSYESRIIGEKSTVFIIHAFIVPFSINISTYFKMNEIRLQKCRDQNFSQGN